MPIPPQRLPLMPLTFQFCMDVEVLTIPDDSENVWFATDLTILDIGLLSAGRLVNDSFIPLPTASALETRSERHRLVRL
jgi:hypothetical protein